MLWPRSFFSLLTFLDEDSMLDLPRDSAQRGSRRILEAVTPQALKDRMPDPVRRGVKTIYVPAIMAVQRLAAKPRISYSWSNPRASEVVANYTRGLVLFGRSDARRAVFEWHSPPTRAVIAQDTAKIPRALRPVRRRADLEVRVDQDFEAIVHSCQQGRSGWVWITPALIDVYREVNQLGFVRTVGTYRDGQLVGGLWGIGVGRVFGIMSMFHRENNAGTLALGALVDVVRDDGRWSAIDCGTMLPHFALYGASEISQEQFCELIWHTLK
jgi:leucyl/phenylalanyl-tRNA--protein transferase